MCLRYRLGITLISQEKIFVRPEEGFGKVVVLSLHDTRGRIGPRCCPAPVSARRKLGSEAQDPSPKGLPKLSWWFCDIF
jgi:hypothetical protein